MEPQEPTDLPDLRLKLLMAWREPAGVFYRLAERTRHDGLAIRPDVVPLDPEFDRFVLTQGLLIWVRPAACRAIQLKAPELADTVLTANLPLNSEGFAYFEKPLIGIAADDGAALKVSGIGWGFNVKTGTDEHCLTASTYLQTRHGNGWCPLGHTDWVIGTDTTAAVYPEADDLRLRSMAEDRQWLAALFRLPEFAKTSVTIAAVPRAVHRRSAAANVSSAVRIVDVG